MKTVIHRNALKININYTFHYTFSNNSKIQISFQIKRRIRLIMNGFNERNVHEYTRERVTQTKRGSARVIPVRLMEISRNIRCGFLRWRNERGHRVLNIAVDLPPRTQVRRNCLVVESEPPWYTTPSSQHGFTNRAKAEPYEILRSSAVPRGTVECFPTTCCGVIVVEIINRGCVRDRQSRLQCAQFRPYLGLASKI